MNEYKFCARCGERLSYQNVDGRVRPVCPVCGNVVYLNPLPAVAAVLLESGRVLLIRRGVEPGAGLWALPSGFMEHGETPEQALIREVQEETGIRCSPNELLSATTHADEVFGHVLVLAYAASFESGEVRAGDDATEASWFVTSNLPLMAFHSHSDFVHQALRNLEYSHELH